MNEFETFFTHADGREEDLRRLDSIITEAAPDLKRLMVDKMIGYGPYHYKYDSGREGDTAVILLANQKNYMSLYVHVVEGGKYVVEELGKKLGKVDTGKSCIRFKHLADLDQLALHDLLRKAVAWHAEQAGK